VEPHVRHLVAEHLGMNPDELVPAVSLTGEVAADSLDMLELVIALESAFDIAVPQPAIREMRSYADVVDAVVSSLLDAGRTGLSTRRDLVVRSRVVSVQSGESAEFVHVDQFGPDAIQTIEDDALRAGSGARLEVAVSSSTSDVDDAALTHVRDRFTWLEERGIDVAVRRA
jgi:acyl carrier protein